MLPIDTEPKLAALLEARRGRRALPPYTPQRDADVADRLQQFFAREATEARVVGLARVGGGGSKEMFTFTLETPGQEPRRYMLRMDPLEGNIETDRGREAEMLAAVAGVVPVPNTEWLDVEGAIVGRPAMIMNFVPGVAKPSGDSAVRVAGMGAHLGPRLREPLRDQFVDNLAKIHAFDWRAAGLRTFDAPTADPQQAARWQVEFWTELWRQDADHASPAIAAAAQWLKKNLPAADELVVVHGDYRTGNYLFDEQSGKITCILDWELCYIGDFHDDLAWFLMKPFGTQTDGVFRAGDLFERGEFLAAYERRTGRTINHKTLHFYEVLSCYKCQISTAAIGMAAARNAHNHQDILLTFLSAAGPIFRSELCRLLSEAT